MEAPPKAKGHAKMVFLRNRATPIINGRKLQIQQTVFSVTSTVTRIKEHTRTRRRHKTTHTTLCFFFLGPHDKVSMCFMLARNHRTLRSLLLPKLYRLFRLMLFFFPSTELRVSINQITPAMFLYQRNTFDLLRLHVRAITVQNKIKPNLF